MRKPLLGLVILFLAPALASGQAVNAPDRLWAAQPQSPPSGESDWGNLQQLRVGQKIEVVDTNLKKYKGTFLSFSEEAISLRVKKDEVGVPRVNVLRVSSLDRSKRKRNILLGLAIGAGAGMLAGAGVASAVVGFDEGQGSKPAATIVGFLAAGAAAGVAVGASSGYRTIYRASRRKSEDGK